MMTNVFIAVVEGGVVPDCASTLATQRHAASGAIRRSQRFEVEWKHSDAFMLDLTIGAPAIIVRIRRFILPESDGRT